MSVLICTFQGRFGNNMLQWLFAKGWAEAHGYELRHESFIGERAFQIDGVRPDGRPVHRVNEDELCELAALAREQGHPPVLDYEFRGYAQTQRCVDFYTKRQAQSWLKLRPEIYAACRGKLPHHIKAIAHRRVGDYLGYGYPVVSYDSYKEACEEYGLNWEQVFVLSEERTEAHPELPDDLQFVADFYRMMRAKTLLRGNSSFSWLAALLGNGLVLAPVVTGLEGGKEHNCEFVAGNWPRFTNLDFVTDLHVSP